MGPNIPLDPKVKPKKSNKAIYLTHLRKQSQVLFSYSGIALSAVSFALYPSLGLAIFIVIHIAMYFLFRRLGIPKPPKNWGKIFDEA
ncbi:MAG: hypothetical protein GWN44_10085, partial [Calditrichae bacterium]|nr:hypothetical protein [Calditrichia bacterium]